LKETFKDIKTLLIVVLVAIILLMRACSGGKNGTVITEPTTITKTITKWDTLKIDSLVYVPRWRTKVTTVHDTIPTDIDTLSILKDYYAKYFYTDTLSLDSLGSIVINDTISRNSILFRNVQPNILIPTITVTNTSYLYQREFFGGVSLGVSPTAIQNINGEILFVNKKRQAYGFGIGLNNEFAPIYTGRLYWKIGK
jgi:hypothetical protein